ncbi:DUF916 and DUF3324 domain-containing protein [Candidatus Enterococcus lemimoniae]|uniref:DUF3324 domain-containing protein n=1 Tax=Candidatus Enterococcus lemimoniae TaxID=1834167 RepID=A0ABZ2T689_9ENTE|nr:DUF916 and DUF3324 domain-containing protein [Enterococcus sp. 12C11_DIV0727]OTO67876.1 hypothetical protein A5866_000071 [Enterococcus sp. 12C11_DIV0727]
MKRKNLFYVLLLFIVVSIGHSIPVLATDAKDNLGYTVSMVQPKTQIDPKQSFFYLQTRPNEPQEIEVRIKSTKKENVKIKIYSQNAITGNKGTIDYTEDLSDQDSSLSMPITEMVHVKTPEITIGNFEEKTVKITITPPEKGYEGIKMGALVFALDQAEKQQNGVATNFSYRIGLIISESGDEFNNGKTLNLIDAKASIKRGKKMVLARIQNPEPKTIEGLTIYAEMTKKGSNTVVKKKDVTNYSLAPNSHVDFELDWGTNSLPSGDYVITLTMHNDYQEWRLTKDFTITGEQAKSINEESAFSIVTPQWIKVLAIMLLVLTGINSTWLIMRRQKWENAWEKLQLTNKKKKKKRKQRRKNEQLNKV